ncbi:MAG: hypothetical protein GX962_12670 [Epulopiscium sp.]|nr:hypothetical protein [Candidatus Epulonipiscium sp.]
MFWTGMISGIFIGVALGIIIVSMALSAAKENEKKDRATLYNMETSEELTPEIDQRAKSKEEEEEDIE